MHKIHPILTEEKYVEALTFIAEEAEKLCQKVVGEKLPINTLTIFAQTPQEYDFLENLLSKKGRTSPFTHGSTLYIEPNLPTLVHGYRVELLGVRRPDALRIEVGYADFPVGSLDKFKGKEYVTEIMSGQGIPLLELRHPDFNVRGYIVER